MDKQTLKNKNKNHRIFHGIASKLNYDKIDIHQIHWALPETHLHKTFASKRIRENGLN